MEHRALPDRSPAIRRYLNEPACVYGRLQATNGSDRDQFYVDSHKSQLQTVQEDVSRREPSQESQFPFLCVFHFAGCDRKFENKWDWKDHILTQHLKLERMFWECNEGRCKHTKRTQIDFKSLLSKDNGTLFANKHDFRTHLIESHRRTNTHDKKEDIIFLPDKEVQWILDRQHSSMRMVCGLPQDLGCPMPRCASVRFTGPTAWDQRLNHAAEHFLATPQCLDVFGGENDAELVQWASSDKVGIYQKAPNVCLRKHDCDKSVADSGYSSMPGMPRQPTISQQGDSSPVLPSKLPESVSDATFSDHSTEELNSSAGSAGIGGWVRDREHLEPIIDEETFSSICQPLQLRFSQHEYMGDHETFGTSEGSGSSDELDGSPETAAVMQWFHGWLRQWLSPLTQERPSGNGNRNGNGNGSQNTASQNQAGSGTSTQKKQGTTRPRRTPKRKRGKDDEGDGNGESPKSQRVDGGQQTRMLACPFYKRNPRKYGQRKWKSCAYPGYESMHRLKHALPEYQCRRCRMDLETSEALEAHSQQLQACTPCIGAQDGLNQEQVKRMRSKKGAGKNKSDVDRWNDVYSIVFPYDQQTPSPYLDDTDQDTEAREFNLCHEFGRFLERELPPLVGRRLSTVECPLPETIKDDIEQYVKELVPQLQGSFLEEMGFVSGDNSRQLDAASTNDRDSFVDSTTTRRTSEDSATTLQQDSISEHQTTTLPKGSTSQEAMSMFPISDGSKELTTMPQVGYGIADSTMIPDGNFSAQGMIFPASQIMPPYFSTSNEDWQAFWQFGYNPNLP
ncbi:hypothetical protein FANTH_11344 [Fusarium anthophilum]|uniref:C2H2-type domain-containing protein n=1 Tax=Fusarium anthophilum TaxID=48485 RepID=A0A8H4YYI9_9HYPO|nr:hypothetical protein FANTH_11344 [Fusarium anthophilum]